MWFFFFLTEKCNQFSSDSPSPHENNRPAHLDQMVLRHVVRDPPNFIVCTENVIMDLKLLSAVIPINTHTDSIRWIIFSSTHSAGAQNSVALLDVRDDHWSHFISDDGFGLVVVDVERLEGGAAGRPPAVRHPVAVETLMQCGLGSSAGSRTHTPLAAVNHRKTHIYHMNTAADASSLSHHPQTVLRTFLITLFYVFNLIELGANAGINQFNLNNLSYFSIWVYKCSGDNLSLHSGLFFTLTGWSSYISVANLRWHLQSTTRHLQKCALDERLACPENPPTAARRSLANILSLKNKLSRPRLPVYRPPQARFFKRSLPVLIEKAEVKCHQWLAGVFEHFSNAVSGSPGMKPATLLFNYIISSAWTISKQHEFIIRVWEKRKKKRQ